MSGTRPFLSKRLELEDILGDIYKGVRLAHEYTHRHSYFTPICHKLLLHGLVCMFRLLLDRVRTGKNKLFLSIVTSTMCVTAMLEVSHIDVFECRIA